MIADESIQKYNLIKFDAEDVKSIEFIYDKLFNFLFSNYKEDHQEIEFKFNHIATTFKIKSKEK